MHLSEFIELKQFIWITTEFKIFIQSHSGIDITWLPILNSDWINDQSRDWTSILNPDWIIILLRGMASLKVLSLESNSLKSESSFRGHRLWLILVYESYNMTHIKSVGIDPTTFITLVLGNLIPFSSLQIIKLNNNALEVN